MPRIRGRGLRRSRAIRSVDRVRVLEALFPLAPVVVPAVIAVAVVACGRWRRAVRWSADSATTGLGRFVGRPTAYIGAVRVGAAC